MLHDDMSVSAIDRRDQCAHECGCLFDGNTPPREWTPGTRYSLPQGLAFDSGRWINTEKVIFSTDSKPQKIGGADDD